MSYVRALRRRIVLQSHGLPIYSPAYCFSAFGRVALPPVANEPELHYAPGSKERQLLKDALERRRGQCPDLPCIVNGEEIRTGDVAVQSICSDHQQRLCTYHRADAATVKQSIDSAVAAKAQWESMPMEERLAIFTKASWLLSNVYRYDVMAAVMLGTGKNAWQAEIDVGVELTDFWRFGARFAQQLYDGQELQHTNGVWNRLEYRPLEGFCVAISPFNFCAIGGNLCSTPAMLGNSVVWKPSSTAVLGNYLAYQILVESGLPPGVINFVPTQGALISSIALSDPRLAAVNFTGSTAVFQAIWRNIGEQIAQYHSYPRIVGETGGKNFHIVHASCDLDTAVNATIRGAFEFSGQKCSATSRVYCARSIWNDFKSRLVAETQKLKMGQPEEFDIFMTAVIDRSSFENIKAYIADAEASEESEIIAGGDCDDSRGFFVSPTVIETRNPRARTMCEEVFGPVLTCYVFEDSEFESTLRLVNETSTYALTGAVFARDRRVIAQATDQLRHAAGNFYINDKCTGAVVGQQPFGGARASGTNDKAGYQSIFYRFASVRAIKENFVPQRTWAYPSMAEP